MLKKILAVLLCLAILSSFVGCKKKAAKTETVVTFADFTDFEIFKDIPAPDMENYKIDDADDYGDGFYVMALRGKGLPSEKEFTDYVALLEKNGFKKYSDSGETGIGNGAMYAATLQRDNKVLALTYAKFHSMMYIAVAEDVPVSPHLVYDDSYVEDNIPGAKTTLTMNQLSDQGNCYVIQLKNGHYIINDGGYQKDLELLIESLKQNAPEGQKPVVEAWFISHEHADHVGVLYDSALFGREIIVEGFYCNQVSEDVAAMIGMSGSKPIGAADTYSFYYKTSTGETTPVYRMHAGERYYFNDITIEVPHTCEQFAEGDYSNNLNGSCTWLLYFIEGQKFLLTGDSEVNNMRLVKDMFSKDYLNVDIMNVHHHGGNMFTDDLDYFKCETLMYSTVCTYSYYWSDQIKADNLALQKTAEEYMSYADGGKKLTFPYEIGSYETLDPWYPTLSEYWVTREQGWLKDAGLL